MVSGGRGSSEEVEGAGGSRRVQEGGRVEGERACLLVERKLRIDEHQDEGHDNHLHDDQLVQALADGCTHARERGSRHIA